MQTWVCSGVKNCYNPAGCLHNFFQLQIDFYTANDEIFFIYFPTFNTVATQKSYSGCNNVLQTLLTTEVVVILPVLANKRLLFLDSWRFSDYWAQKNRIRKKKRRIDDVNEIEIIINLIIIWKI